jgi:hypothetical protein
MESRLDDIIVVDVTVVRIVPMPDIVKLSPGITLYVFPWLLLK